MRFKSQIFEINRINKKYQQLFFKLIKESEIIAKHSLKVYAKVNYLKLTL